MNARVARRLRLLEALAADERAPEGERAAARDRIAALRAANPEPAERPIYNVFRTRSMNATFGGVDLDDFLRAGGQVVAEGTTNDGYRWTMRATHSPGGNR